MRKNFSKMNRRRLLLGALQASSGLMAFPALQVAASAAPQSSKKPAPGSVSVNSRAELVSHWKLDGDSQDPIGKNHGDARSISYVEGIDGRPNGAASFNGLNSVIEVPDAANIDFAAGEFSISLWVKLNENIESAPGDLLCKFVKSLRRGYNFSVLGNASGYSSYGDVRGVHFGIDNGINGSWIDLGRPWKTNPTIPTFTVYKGQLYAGLGDAARPDDACHVFRLDGEKWVDCGRLGADPLTPSVMSTIVHKGLFYAGTGAWDWEKSNVGRSGRSHVYCYEGGTQWRDCGALGNAFCVMSFASFKGDLYACDDAAKCFRYDGDRSWVYCGQPDHSDRLQCFMPFQGSLYAGTTDGLVFRYEGGEKWECIGRNPHGTIQVHKLQVYEGRLLAGTWPKGKVLRYEGGQDWTDLGELGISTEQFQINEVNDLQVYNGMLYAGVIPKAEVYRLDGDRWILLRTLVADPSYAPGNVYSWARITCMAGFNGRLFHGTSTCAGKYDRLNPSESGRVHSMEAGKNTSYDDDLGTTWRHLAAVREKSLLKLYLDGNLVSTSPAFDQDDYDLSNRSPLTIGFGAKGYLNGALDDVRLYRGALAAGQVREQFLGRGKGS